MISTTGGMLASLLEGCLAKRFLTDSRPRSATMTLEEDEDWGRKMTGALKWTFRAIRVLRSASSFTPYAAFSAAWTVTSARASLASWKLLMKAWWRKSHKKSYKSVRKFERNLRWKKNNSKFSLFFLKLSKKDKQTLTFELYDTNKLSLTVKKRAGS